MRRAGHAALQRDLRPYTYPALERAAGKLMQFSVLIEQCAALLNTLPLDAFYEELLVRTGYVAMLEQKDDLENRSRLENVRELKSSIVTYMESSDTPTLAGFFGGNRALYRHRAV